jgi:hypothetical protein
MRTTLVLQSCTFLFIACCHLFGGQQPTMPTPSNSSAQPQPTPNVPVVNEPAAGQPGQQRPRHSNVRQNPREQAWQLLERACTSDKTTSRATAVLVLGLIPNNKRSAEMAEKALTDSKP